MTGKLLKSWGGYPIAPQISHPTSWLEDVAPLFSKVASNGETLAFGNGRSYGDSCLSASNHVIHTKYLNKFIQVNWHTGLLRVESGVTLEEILNVSIPNGWFLPVTPGTKFVTLGGAVANDVHGKNHHVRGTFGCHVKQLALLRSMQGQVICSSEENSNLFNATIGGLGLTGIILWVELQLLPVESSLINIVTEKFGSISEFIQLSDELDRQSEYSVAWIDCAAKGRNLGRGIFMAGDHCSSGELTVHSQKKLTVPFTPPVSLINQTTLKTFNYCYFHKALNSRSYSRTGYDPFFYPLDNINNWNRIYGKAGFQQFQCIVPPDNALQGINKLLTEISNSGLGSFLAVLKRCGNIKSPGLLSFPVPGISLALDFPNTAHLPNLLSKLDAIVRENYGRLYPAKDAHMTAETFQLSYPKWTELQKLKDPHLTSKFWNRVTQ